MSEERTIVQLKADAFDMVRRLEGYQLAIREIQGPLQQLNQQIIELEKEDAT